MQGGFDGKVMRQMRSIPGRYSDARRTAAEFRMPGEGLMRYLSRRYAAIDYKKHRHRT